MTKRYSVIWFDAQNGERRGSASNEADAVKLLHAMGPHDWIRGVVKFGNKVVYRRNRED